MNYLIAKTGEKILIDKEYQYLQANVWRIDSTGYPCSKGVRLHTIVMGKQKKGWDIDHKKGNKLDNRRSQLRVCEHRFNIANAQKRPNNTTGYIGVWQDKRNKIPSFIAQYCKKGKTIYIGTFRTAIEAAKARDDAALKEYGEFAVLNLKGAN